MPENKNKKLVKCCIQMDEIGYWQNVSFLYSFLYSFVYFVYFAFIINKELTFYQKILKLRHQKKAILNGQGLVTNQFVVGLLQPTMW